MNDELLAMVEREVLGWDGVSRDPDRRHVALYRFGRRQIGHVPPRRRSRSHTGSLC